MTSMWNDKGGEDSFRITGLCYLLDHDETEVYIHDVNRFALVSSFIVCWQLYVYIPLILVVLLVNKSCISS